VVTTIKVVRTRARTTSALGLQTISGTIGVPEISRNKVVIVPGMYPGTRLPNIIIYIIRGLHRWHWDQHKV
jgi:hypothetical protein